nr:MAG TPA: hypothetical protein [Caudoviricetes sp.]
MHHQTTTKGVHLKNTHEKKTKIFIKKFGGLKIICIFAM